MASPIGDFLRNYMGVVSLMQQDQSLRQRALDSLAVRGTSATEIAAAIPGQEARQGQAENLARLFNVDPNVLAPLLGAIGPAEGVMRRSFEEQGAAELSPQQARVAALRAVTGMTPSQTAADELLTEMTPQAAEMAPSFLQSMREGLTSRLLTGQDPGAAVLSSYMARRPEEEMHGASRIAFGLQPTAAQQAQLGLGYAGLRQQERALVQQGALAEARLALDQARWESQAAATGQIDLNPGSMIQHWTRLQTDLTENKVGMTEGERTIYHLAMNDIAMLLREAGIQALPVIPEDQIGKVSVSVRQLVPEALRRAWQGNP